MKKITSLFLLVLAGVLLLSCFTGCGEPKDPGNKNAGDEGTLLAVASDMSVRAGDTFTVEFYLTAEKVKAFELPISYDKTVLTLLSLTESPSFAYGTAAAAFTMAGYDNITAAATEELSAAAGLKIATATFQVAAGAAAGSTTVSVPDVATATDRTGYGDGTRTDLPFTCTPAVITVSAE